MLAITPAAEAAPLPDVDFTSVPMITGLTQPVAVRFARDGTVFVAEAAGVVKVFDSLADRTATVLVDLRTQVHRQQDRGLMGLAVHPDYPNPPWIWVYFQKDAVPGGQAPRYGPAGQQGYGQDGCPSRDGCPATAELRRLVVGPDRRTIVDQVTLISDQICHQFPVHGSNGLVYGPDGALYATAGDGAWYQGVDYGQLGGSDPASGVPQNACGDPPVPPGGTMEQSTAEGGAFRALDWLTPNDPLQQSGAAIRINPETGAPLASNPMFGGATADDRHIAIGLRNAFRFTFDPAGNIWYGDVGHEAWEEFNAQAPTTFRNFGWPCYEGAAENPDYKALNNDLCNGLYAKPSQVSGPAYAYAHNQTLGNDPDVPPEQDCVAGQVISGMAFYDGVRYPKAYQGALFFADAWAGCVYAIKPDVQGHLDPSTLTVVVHTPNVVDIQAGPNDLLYLVDFNGGRVLALTTAVTDRCTGEDSFEPNETFQQAARVDEGIYDGAICLGGDHDWFAIFARAGDRVRMSVESDSSTSWTAYGPSPLIYEAGLAIGQGSGNGSTWFRATSTGWHSIDIRASLPANTLSVPYRLDIQTCAEDALGNSRVPGPTGQGDAIPYQLRNDRPVSGVRCAGMEDVFTFEANAGDRVTLALSRPANDGTTLGQGGVITTTPPWISQGGTFVAPAEAQSDETSVRTTYNIQQTSRYYFVVAGPASSVADGPYTVTMQGSSAGSAFDLSQLYLTVRLCRLIPPYYHTVKAPPRSEKLLLEAADLDISRISLRLC